LNLTHSLNLVNPRQQEVGIKEVARQASTGASCKSWCHWLETGIKLFTGRYGKYARPQTERKMGHRFIENLFPFCSLAKGKG